MEEKIKKYTEKAHDFIQSLRDLRRLGLFVFIGILLVMTWSGIKVVERNYELQKQINELQQEVEVSKLKNDNLRLGNKYYETDTYLELSARQNFGLAMPGETEVIVPKDVALAKLAKLPASPEQKLAAKNNSSFMAKNFRSWINFFMHRQQVIDTSD